MKEVHGHEVIELLQATTTEANREAILDIINEHFGMDCLFFNCSKRGMSAEDLIKFFEEKGKLIFSQTGFQWGDPNRCKHA